MLYLMRHGITDWNRVHRLQGHTDIPLNAAGREAARRAGAEYRDMHFDLCYSSPLIRAKETAELVLAGRDVPIRFDDRLRELCFGCCEGHILTDYPPEDPIRVLFQHPEDYQPVENGESLTALFDRLQSFLDDKIAPEIIKGSDVLIVAHGALNSGILNLIRKRPLSRFWETGIQNCRLISVTDEEVLGACSPQ